MSRGFPDSFFRVALLRRVWYSIGMIKNTNPRTLDESNLGDSAVFTFGDGSTQTVKITFVFREEVRLEWRADTHPLTRYLWLPRQDWGVLQLFPEGVKFLVI